MTGFEEFKSLQKAEEELCQFDRVEVIKYQLGFQGHRRKTYFVSKWINLPTVHALQIAGFEKISEILERVWEIKKHLIERGFADIHTGNMLYDTATGVIYLFDIVYVPLLKTV